MSDELRAGVKISDHLELVSLLGSGAMGSVWLGRDHKLDREVAIKVILDDPSDARSQQRFEREAKVAARLDHPHVIQVFDFGWYGDFPFIVMERLDGEPLDARLHRDGRLSPGDAERLVAQLGQALKVMHGDGVVHRDIKPANLFLLAKVDDLFVKIIDFGIARAPVAEGTGMTTTGALVGTPSYMSPEQLFDGVRATASSDLWALAVVAYEACTGQLPFAADNIAALGKLLSAGRFEAPSKVHGDLPPGLDDFFARALAIEPEARFEDASAFLDAWSQAMASGDGGTEVESPKPTPSVTAVTERRELGTMGRYRLLLELGHGGMAEVFVALAVDEAMGADKLVVLKRPHAHDDAMARQMFLDEARIAARLRHRNVVQTLEAGEADGVPFIVMEYLEGQPLRRWMKEGVLPEALRVHVVVEILRGLHEAHGAKDFDGSPLKVIHRDVSPHNVMVTYEGEIKLLDFGIATAAHRLTDTRSGTVKGKATYMAPEQARGDAVDRRVDVFAAGVVLWELLTGRRYWGSAKPKEIEHRLRAGELPDEMPDTAGALVDVCRRALQAEPRARFETAEAMADALEAAATDMEVVASPRKALAALATEHFAEERRRMEAELERVLTAVFAEAQDPPPEVHTKTELASPKTVVTRTQTMSSAPPPSRAAGAPRRLPLAAGLAAVAAVGLGWFATRDTTSSETTPTARPTATQTTTATAPQPAPITTSTSTSEPPPPDHPKPEDPPPTSAPATMPAPPPPPTAAPPSTTRPFDDHDPWEEAMPSATN